jgi:hypothetical protein
MRVDAHDTLRPWCRLYRNRYTRRDDWRSFCCAFLSEMSGYIYIYIYCIHAYTSDNEIDMHALTFAYIYIYTAWIIYKHLERQTNVLHASCYRASVSNITHQNLQRTFRGAHQAFSSVQTLNRVPRYRHIYIYIELHARRLRNHQSCYIR